MVLNQKCIRDGWINIAQARLMVERAMPEAKRVVAADILVNSTGVGTLGRVGRWHSGIVAADSHVSIVKPNAEVVGPTVLAYSLFGREVDIEAMATGSTGQTELSPDRLGELIVSVPTGSNSFALEATLIAIENKIDSLRMKGQGTPSFRNYSPAG
jgi:type I restriction enzyme S subunit